MCAVLVRDGKKSLTKTLSLQDCTIYLYHQQNILRKPTMVTHLHVGHLQSRDFTGGSDAIMTALIIDASRLRCVVS